MSGTSGPPVLAVIGGGQLARMMAQAAIALDLPLRLLAEGERVSAAQVVPDTTVGDYRDLATLRTVAEGCSVVTFDHEHVPPPHLETLAREGHACRPGPTALVHAQDKAVMRARLDELGIPSPRHAVVTTTEEVDRFASSVGGYPVVLKTSRGGYDGKGVWVIDDARAGEVAFAAAATVQGGRVLAEEKVGFRRELSALVARSPSGQVAAYPVVESEQRNGVCWEVTAPAPDLAEPLALEAQQIAMTLAASLEVTGVLAVELFETVDGRILVNELAMRPHNTGHWSIDGAVTSQFENHLRAVMDLPLGSPAARQPWAVMVNILGGEGPLADELYAGYPHVFARDPDLKVHLYGKEVKSGRKVGHVTAYGDDLDEVRARARHAAAWFRGEPTDDLEDPAQEGSP